MKKIIKLTHLIVFVSCASLKELVERACNNDDLDLNTVSIHEELEIVIVTEEDANNIEEYRTLIEDKADNMPETEEFRETKLQVLYRVLNYCIKLIPDINEHKSLFVQNILGVLKDKIRDQDKIANILCLLIYQPGAHFFLDTNVGDLLERMLIKGELSQDNLMIILNFVARGKDTFKSNLRDYLNKGHLYLDHRTSIENFWKGLCDYADASELAKFTQKILICLELGMPIPQIPDNIRSKKDDDLLKTKNYIEVLEGKTQNHPELAPLLRAWINLIGTDEANQKNMLCNLAYYLHRCRCSDLELILLDEELLCFREGIVHAEDIESSHEENETTPETAIEWLKLARKRFKTNLSRPKFREEFEALIQSLRAMPQCPERKASIDNFLNAIDHQNTIP